MCPGRLLALLPLTVLLGCDPGEAVHPATPLRAAATAGDDPMADAVLLVGNLIPGDHARNGILRYDGAGMPIDEGRFIPNGSGGLTGGCCMAVGPDEYIYVSSTPHGAVLRFHPVTGAFEGQFVKPGTGLFRALSPAFGPDGNLYVGDFLARSIVRFDGRTGDFIDVFVEPGAGGMAGFDPQGFRFGPDGHLYVASEATHRILRFHGETGDLIDEFVPAGSGGVTNPSDVTFGSDGHLYVSSGSNQVLKYDGGSGAFLGEFVTAGSGGLSVPVRLVFGPDGHLYVTSSGGNAPEIASILRFDGQTGRFIDVFVPPGRGGLSGPRMLEFKTKITMCHRPPGNPGARRTISIGYRFAADHIAHGDDVGAC